MTVWHRARVSCHRSVGLSCFPGFCAMSEGSAVAVLVCCAHTRCCNPWVAVTGVFPGQASTVAQTPGPGDPVIGLHWFLQLIFLQKQNRGRWVQLPLLSTMTCSQQRCKKFSSLKGCFRHRNSWSSFPKGIPLSLVMNLHLANSIKYQRGTEEPQPISSRKWVTDTSRASPTERDQLCDKAVQRLITNPSSALYLI